MRFPESVERLAGIAGMDMPKIDPRAEERAKENKKTISWMERAQEFFAKSLMLRDAVLRARRQRSSVLGMLPIVLKRYAMS